MKCFKNNIVRSKTEEKQGMIVGKFRIVSIAGSQGEECTRIGYAFVKLGHVCVRVHSLSCTCKLLHFIMYFTIINPKNTQHRKKRLRQLKQAYLAFKKHILRRLKAFITITITCCL